MRVFLTGVTGTVGREVYRALCGRGVDVRLGSRPSSDVAKVAPDATDIVPLDFEDPRPSPAHFEGVDALFFMTPLIEDQVSASHRVLKAAIEGGVSHVVRLSSRSAGWDERSELRAWHRQIEGIVKDLPASWTVLRPCSFFQNFIRYQAESVRSMASIIVPQGDGLISYVDASDIGAVAAECLVHPQTHRAQTYVLTGGRAYGVKGVAAEIGRVIGKPITYIDIDPEQAETSMSRAALPSWLIEAALAVFAHARAGGEADVDPALAKILRRPATTLSEFVERNRSAWL